MKKLLILFFLSWCSTQVFAQKDSVYSSSPVPGLSKRNILKIAPFRLAAATMAVSYERAISPHASLLIRGSIISATKTAYNGGNYKCTAFGGGGDIELRNYPLATYTPLKGFFAGLYGSFSYTGFTYEASSVSSGATPPDEYIRRYGAGVVMGYQFIIKEVIALDLYAGGGIRKVDTNINNYYSYNPFDLLSTGTSSGVYPRAGFNFGLCF